MSRPMKISISNQITANDIPDILKNDLVDRLTFPNPAFIEAERMSRWTGNIERFLWCYGETREGALIISRGYCRQLIILCRREGVPYQIDDRRRTLPEVDFTFKGKLKPFQGEACRAVLSRDFGTLSAPTGSGKTVMCLYIVAERKQPALVIVHNKELMHQWADRAKQFLGLSDNDIGIIGNGRKDLGRPFTVGIVNTIYKMTHVLREQTGFLIVDEVHRVASRVFIDAVSAFDCRYQLGLSATCYRRDGLSRLLFWTMGDMVHEVKRSQLIGEGFDCPDLSTLFLTTPIKYDGRVLQYLGRVLRPAPGKGKAKVHDYIDNRVGVLKASAKARKRVYFST